MTTTECPLCDEPTDLDPGADAFDCATCGVRLELASDPGPASGRRMVATAA